MLHTCTYRSMTQDSHPMLAVTAITFFFWLMWFIWSKQKQQSKCYTRAESSPKHVPRWNQSDVGEEKSRTTTWTCNNTTVDVLNTLDMLNSSPPMAANDQHCLWILSVLCTTERHAEINCNFQCHVDYVNLYKEYLNMVTFNISVILNWTLWYIECLCKSSYTGAINFWRSSVFGPPCTFRNVAMLTENLEDLNNF